MMHPPVNIIGNQISSASSSHSCYKVHQYTICQLLPNPVLLGSATMLDCFWKRYLVPDLLS